ncbi:MAG: phosphosulfolactate synthase [Acidimicrobiales bacterium]
MSFNENYLDLPNRVEKPRRAGLTMAIDKGTPRHLFADIVESQSDYVDFVKFGWGTSIVDKFLKEKLAALSAAGVDFYFGGTLFEKYILQGRFSEFRDMCWYYDCQYVEVSNGTIALSDAMKSEYVAALAKDFKVISEVGSKDQLKSENMAPYKWISYISDDLDAGATLVTLETREGGRSGMCRPNGDLRIGLVEEILTSGLDVDRLLFEAPTSDLQCYFVKRVGPNVNLGNVAPADLVGLETIRLGLRSETLLEFEPLGVGSPSSRV